MGEALADLKDLRRDKERIAREAQEPRGGVDVVRADELAIERVRWLWRGYLARGKFHVLAGPPGVNKTTAAMAMSATTSSAGRWPDGTQAERGSVLIWSGEDGIGDTLLPRLIAHDADLSRIHFVRDISDVDGERRPFDPSMDMDDLTLAALRIDDLALVVIDPVVLTVKGDSNTNGDVRRGLLPLVTLGERTGAATVGVTHFSKNTAGRRPIERVTGSLAFGAAARIVHVFTRLTEEQGGGRALLRAKSNIGPDGGGFAFDVEPIQVAGAETIRLLWRGPIDGEAHDILAAAERCDDPDERAALDDTAAFLRSMLIDAGGSMNRKEVIVAAKRAGYSERTIERARTRCSITVKTSGFGKSKHSVWSVADTNTVTNLPTQSAGSNDGNDNNDDKNERDNHSITANTVNLANTASVRAHARGDGNAPVNRYRHATSAETLASMIVGRRPRSRVAGKAEGGE